MTNEPTLAGPSAGETVSSLSRWRGKLAASVFSVAMIVAVLSPIAQNWRKIPNDTFPLSYYPMFTEKRSARQRVTYLVGLDAKGGERRLHYTMFGNGGLNQVRHQINKMVEKGEAKKIGERVASEVVRKNLPRHSGVVAIEVRTGTFLLDDYFEKGAKKPVAVKVLARCPVKREAR